MASENSRRTFVKAAGMAGVTGLAGCISGSSGSSGGTQSIKYWEYFHSQSEVASEQLKSSVKEFEKENDVKIQTNWASWSDINGGKWQNNIQNGNRPVMYDSTNSLDGQFIERDWVKPLSEYKDKLDDEALENIQNALDMVSSCYRSYDEDVYEVPIGMEVGAPFIARADHFEKAGLSIEEDFPPKDYQDLVRIAEKLKADGPSDTPFQVYGATGDVTDEALVTWTASEGGTDGMYLNQDWSDVNYDNDVWKENFKKYVDLHKKYGFSSDKAPKASNESAAQMLISGDTSMVQGSTKDFGLLRSRAEDMLKDGTIIFGPSWKGSAGNRGDFFTQCIAVLRPPEGADEEEWEKKQEVAYDWINRLLSKDFQREVPNSLATLPVRQDVQKELLNSDGAIAKSNFIDSLDTMASDIDLGWSSQSNMTAIQYDIAGPIFQKAMLGKISPEEACNRAAKRIRKQFDL